MATPTPTSTFFNHLSFAEFGDTENRVREEFELAVRIVTHKPWSLKFFGL
jgi:hypothetical protein